MRAKSLFHAILIFTGIASFSCSQHKETISGHIDGWGDEPLILNCYTFSGTERQDTIYATGGSFSYNSELEEIAQFSIFRTADIRPRSGGYFIPQAKSIDIILFPGDRLKIKGRAEDNAIDYTISGSEFMKDLSNIRSQTLIYEMRKDSIEFGLNAAMERNAPAGEQEVFFTQRRALNDKIREVEGAYIRNYPAKELSAVFILKQPIDSFPVYYELLPENVREGHFKLLLDELKSNYDEYQAYLENSNKEFTGQPAPDFTLTDVSGQTFSLAGFKSDKYIVLDFWGSWCGPCLHGMPEMKRYYDKYKNRLEIIGIACRDNEADWKKAIADNALPWIHLLNDESSLENSISVRYAIGAYPTKILLSPDRTILEIFVGEGDDFYQKLDELLSGK